MRKIVALIGAVLLAAAATSVVVVFGLQGDGSPLEPEPASAVPVKWTMAEVRAFDEHELFYLGESFTDRPTAPGAATRQLPLLNILRIDYPGAHPDEDDPLHELNRPNHAVIFVYGDCVIPPGEDRCPVPLTVTVGPADEIPSEMVKTGDGPPQCIRGALVQKLKGGNLLMWTGKATVGIEQNGVNISTALGLLRRANGSKPDVPGQPFPPPKGGKCNS